MFFHFPLGSAWCWVRSLSPIRSLSRSLAWTMWAFAMGATVKCLSCVRCCGCCYRKAHLLGRCRWHFDMSLMLCERLLRMRSLSKCCQLCVSWRSRPCLGASAHCTYARWARPRHSQSDRLSEPASGRAGAAAGVAFGPLAVLINIDAALTMSIFFIYFFFGNWGTD